jgi:hypothetical protein
MNSKKQKQIQTIIAHYLWALRGCSKNDDGKDWKDAATLMIQLDSFFQSEIDYTVRDATTGLPRACHYCGETNAAHHCHEGRYLHDFSYR